MAFHACVPLRGAAVDPRTTRARPVVACSTAPGPGRTWRQQPTSADAPNTRITPASPINPAPPATPVTPVTPAMPAPPATVPTTPATTFATDNFFISVVTILITIISTGVGVAMVVNLQASDLKATVSMQVGDLKAYMNEAEARWYSSVKESAEHNCLRG